MIPFVTEFVVGEHVEIKMRACAPPSALASQKLGLGTSSVRVFNNPVYKANTRDVSANVLSVFASPASKKADAKAAKQLEEASAELPDITEDVSQGTISMRRAAKKPSKTVGEKLSPTRQSALQRTILDALSTVKGMPSVVSPSKCRLRCGHPRVSDSFQLL